MKTHRILIAMFLFPLACAAAEPTSYLRLGSATVTDSYNHALEAYPQLTEAQRAVLRERLEDLRERVEEIREASDTAAKRVMHREEHLGELLDLLVESSTLRGWLRGTQGSPSAGDPGEQVLVPVIEGLKEAVTLLAKEPEPANLPR